MFVYQAKKMGSGPSQAAEDFYFCLIEDGDAASKELTGKGLFLALLLFIAFIF